MALAALQVVQSAEAAEVLLHAERLRILERLEEPGSSSSVARLLQMPRQKVNYHLRELERHGFVRFIEERKRGNCLERVVQAAARSYVISPVVLGGLGWRPQEARDRFSSGYLVASASRLIRDVALLRSRADQAGQRLATLTIESEIRFADAAARHRFTEELAQTVAALVAKHHDETAPSGRSFRLLVGAYPKITKETTTEENSPHVPFP